MLVNAMRLCEASHGVVWLREGDGFRSAALHGPWPEGFVEQWRSGTLVHPGPDAPITRAAESGKAIQVADLSESPAYRDGDPLPVAAVDVVGIRTVLSVTMFKDDEYIGAIALSRREVRLFSDKQVDLVANFAKQAVIAVENARLLREIRARTDDLSESLEQQTATSEVLEIISASAGELDPVFQKLLENATRICGAKFGMMWMIEGDVARCMALHNAPEAFAELRQREPLIQPSPLNVMGRMMRTKQVVQIEDARAERAYIEGDPIRRANVDLAGARTLVAVPMLRENELIGAITIFRQEVKPFTEKQIDLVANFAKQAVIAIENARLLRELHARTDDLTESLQQQTATADVLKVISRSAFDLKSVLTTLTDSAKALCGASLGIICLRDGEVMRLRAESGCTPAFVDFMQAHPIRPGRDTITGRVFMAGKPVNVPDVQLDPEYDFGQAPTIGHFRAVLAVPLTRDGAVE